MNRGNTIRHCVSIHCPCIFQQFFGTVKRAGYALPPRIVYCIIEFMGNLLIRNKYFSLLFIISQISKMNKKCQHIILCLECSHIILEFIRINLTPSISKHLNHGFLKTVKVPVNMDL